MSEQELAEQVEDLRTKSGLNVKDACEKAGIAMHRYYKARRKPEANGADEWGEKFEAAAQTATQAPNPAQEIDRLSRLVAAQGAILSQAGIFVSVK